MLRKFYASDSTGNESRYSRLSCCAAYWLVPEVSRASASENGSTFDSGAEPLESDADASSASKVEKCGCLWEATCRRMI